MKKIKKYTVSWDEYLTCLTTVEAESEEEAERKFLDGQHGEVIENIESCDELEIYEDDDETAEEEEEPKTTDGDLNPDSVQSDSGGNRGDENGK